MNSKICPPKAGAAIAPRRAKAPAKKQVVHELTRYLRLYKQPNYGSGGGKWEVEADLYDEVDHDMPGVWVKMVVRVPEHAFEASSVALIDLSDSFEELDPTVLVADLMNLRGSLE